MKKTKIIVISALLLISSCFNSFAGTWKQENNGWKYQNDDGSYVSGSWKEVNGKWYYFDQGGYMLSNTTTPDGYTVNELGEWVQSITDIKAKTGAKTYTFNSRSEWVRDGNIPEGEYVYYPVEQGTDMIVKGSYSVMSNFNYIKLYKTDIVNPGTYIPVSEAGELDITKEGVFLVGRDIKAGTYTLTPTKAVSSRAECIVFSEMPSSKDASLPQKNMEQDFFVGKKANNTVTVNDGQCIQIKECTANFVRP